MEGQGPIVQSLRGRYSAHTYTGMQEVRGSIPPIEHKRSGVQFR